MLCEPVGSQAKRLGLEYRKYDTWEKGRIMLSLPSEVSAPLMALAGIGLSALVSLVLSSRTVRVETEKLHSQFQQVYATKLVETRVETYPELYSYLSGFSKLARRRVPSRSELEALQGKVDSWDSKYAIFLGKDSVNICYFFRMELDHAIPLAAEEPSARDFAPEWLSLLLRRVTALELGLRSDLGLYGLKIKGLLEDFEPPTRGHW